MTTQTNTSAKVTMTTAHARQLLEQIGCLVVGSVSGGRRHLIDGTLVLPVSSGYTVEVDLTPADSYTVRRVFTRAAVRWVKGEVADVYCDQIGEVVYLASCYKNVPFGE